MSTEIRPDRDEPSPKGARHRAVPAFSEIPVFAVAMSATVLETSLIEWVRYWYMSFTGRASEI